MNILMLNLSWLSCLVVFAWAPFSFRTCLLVCATPPTVFLILSRFMEESPLWLVGLLVPTYDVGGITQFFTVMPIHHR